MIIFLIYPFFVTIMLIFFSGGMQDYNYLWHGCMELTLEIGCCKYPPVEHLPSAWNENLKVALTLFQTINSPLKIFALRYVVYYFFFNATTLIIITNYQIS